MKKIWLRKEREDSKSQLESKPETKVEASTCEKNINDIPVREVDVTSKDENDVTIESRIQSTHLELDRSSKVPQNFSTTTTLIPENGFSFYPPMDASHIHPAYILAIRQNELPSFVQGAVNPYQLSHQIQFAVPNALSFLPVTQMKKFGMNGSNYDSFYDSYLVQSAKEDRKYSDQSDDRRYSNHSSVAENGFHKPGSLSKFDYSQYRYSGVHPGKEYIYNFLNRNSTRPQEENHSTLPRSKSPLLVVRKRAPNSPLEVPITPTTAAGSVFSRAFVVPRNMMKLSDEKENSDTVRNVDSTAALLPSMIVDMTELEVRDGERTTSDRIDDSNKRDVKPAVKGVLNFRPYETMVTSSTSGHSVEKNENYGTSTKSEHVRDNNNTNEKRTATNQQHHNNNNNNNRDNNRDNNNSNNNNINRDNNNNKDTRPPTIAPLKDKQTKNVSIATTAEDPPSNGDQTKEPPNALVTTTSRGKGRPAKGVGKPGVEPSPNIGLRSVIKCPTCMKVFNNSSALAKHKLTHSDERKYSCHLCSKAFKRQDHLNGHMMTHSSKKPFECKFLGCTKSYCDARSLRRHLENHHHDSINSCNSATAAGYATTLVDGSHGNESTQQQQQQPDSRTLTRYIDDHWNPKVVWAPGFNPLDEPKPVRCHVCGRCFKNVPALNGHMRLHGGYVNRDTDDDRSKHLGQVGPSDVSTTTESLKKMLWDSNPATKAFDGKTRYHHHGDEVTSQFRASSLECLTSPRARSTSTTPWEVMKEELERVKSKSCSLPRDDVRGSPQCRVDQMVGFRDGRLLLQSDFDHNIVSRNIINAGYKSASSGVIDLTKGDQIYDRNRQDYSYDHKVESSTWTAKMGGRISSLEMEGIHSSKYSNSFHAMPSVTSARCFKNASEEILNKRVECVVEKSSEISPKHLQASSLYQRRLRRFSERSPNSDESSRQSGGTPPPVNHEKSEIKADDFYSTKQTLKSESGKSVREEMTKSFVAPVLSYKKESFEENPKFLPSKTFSTDRLNLSIGDSKQEQEKIYSSHPSLFLTHHSHVELNKAQPINITITSSEVGSKPNLTFMHGTPNENPNVSLLHQSHSSLPCTPYTAHTPYTPRTTEPISPRQASFFQFPPSLQPEGSKVPGMEAPSMSAFDPESQMETARIPEDAYERVARKQDKKMFDCKTASTTGGDVNSSDDREELTSSEESSHRNYLKARGKVVEQRTNQIRPETGSSQEKPKEKLSSRRKVKPAPLVLPPQKEIRERYIHRHDTDYTILSSSSSNRSPPRNLSPAPLEFRTALYSSVSSLDSGYPKSSARSTLESGCLNSSEMFKFVKESNTNNHNSSSSSGHQCKPRGNSEQPIIDFSSSEIKSIKVGPEFQASIPQYDANKCRQKEKAEPWLPSKDWPDTLKGFNWSEMETQRFSRGVYSANKDFAVISKMVGSRSMKECIQFYYTWKKKHHGDYRRHKTMRRSFGGRRLYLGGTLRGCDY